MDIDNYVGNYSKGAFAFNRMVQTGVSVDPESDSLTAWFNAQYYHSVPEAHLLAVNLLFRTNMSASSAVPRMSVEIDPMPITALEESTGGSTSIGNSLAFAMSILFALNVSLPILYGSGYALMKVTSTGIWVYDRVRPD